MNIPVTLVVATKTECYFRSLESEIQMNDISHLGPFTTLNAWRDAMRQFLAEGRVDPSDVFPSALASMFVPVDVLDTGDDFLIRADMPGVKAEKLKITLSGNTLTLKGDVEPEADLEEATYLHRERRVAGYTRSIPLPAAIEAKEAQAVFRDGVLSLTLPKSEKVRPKTIKVTTS